MNRYIIVGKGASGKDWLQKKFVKNGYSSMKQYTTRPIRDSETGNEYHFVTDEEFTEMKNNGDFVSVNFYSIGWYGISILDLMCCDVAILSPANVNDVFEKYPDLRKNFKIIYLDIPIDIRRKRLSKRYSHKFDDSTERRLSADENDFKDFKNWDIRLESIVQINNFVNNISPLKLRDITDKC